MVQKRIWSVLGLLFVLCGSTTSLWAQAVFGSIYGTVTDASGAAIPNATVVVTDTAKGIHQTVQSNETGNYRADRLVPDPYSIHVSADGFAAFETEGVLVTANGEPKVDAILQIAGTTQTIQVSAAPPALQTSNAEISHRLSEQTINDVPSLTRNFAQFQELTPGTSRAPFQNSLSQNPQGSPSFSINGQNFGTQSWTLDGTDNRDPVLGIIVINPTLDSVQGIQVLTQNYDAEFGGAAGGVVTAETKSGGNNFHGDAFFYRHTDAQQARDPFINFQRSPLTNKYLPSSVFGQFGGSISGPIIKNRTFFFLDYQGTRQKAGQSLLLNVPTALAKNTCLNPSSATCDLSEYLAGGVHQIYNPTTRAPYTNNQIPTSQLAPQAVKLLSQIPAPNVAGAGISNNYAAAGSGSNNGDAANLRIDDQTTARLHSFARYSYVIFRLNGPNAFGAAGGAGLGPGNFAGTDKVQNQSLATGFDFAVNASLATDFRFGLLKYAVAQNKPDNGQPSAANLGIPNLNTSASGTSGLPDFLFTNGTISNLGTNIVYNGTQICNCPLQQSEQEFQFVNNWTKTFGNHTLRFGGDVRYAMNIRNASDTNRTGVLNFNQNTTGDGLGNGGLDLATLLTGNVTSFQRAVSFSNNSQNRQKRAAFFGQDSWRVTPKFTLNYGLRWELTFPETVTGHGLGGFTNLQTGFVQVAGVGNFGSNGGAKMDYTNLSPRLGLAYQVRPDTVIHAGIATLYDGEGFYGTLFGTSLTQNLPVFVQQDLEPASTNGSVFDLATGPTSVSAPVIPADGLIPIANGNSFSTVRPARIQLPKVDQWNLSLQQQVGSSTTFEIAYVGNHSERTYPGSTFGFNTNAPRLPTTPAELSNSAARRPLYNKFNNNGVICCDSNINSGAPSSTAGYNALQTKFTQRFSNNVQIQANYTWSKAMNHVDPYFFWDPKVNYARNDLNRTNLFNLFGSYELPFGNGKTFINKQGAINYLVGGWQISGSSTWESGLPFTPTYAECASDQDIDNNVTSGVLCRPNGSADGFRLGASSINPNTHAVTYFTPVAPLSNSGSSSGPFQRPSFGTFGNIGRNSFVGPREFTADASLMKKFAITERVNGQFQFQAFNVFNHPALGLPTQRGTNGACIDCSTNNGNPGQITSLDPNVGMRQLQFAFRIAF